MRNPTILLTVVWLLASITFAAPIEFGAEVLEWDPSGGLPASMKLSISGGYEISVKVTNFTEVKNEQGFPVLDTDVKPGDQVEIEAILTSEGWVALEVQIQDEESEFELKGPVESLVGNTLMVNGFALEIVTGITRIRDQFGRWVDLASFQQMVDESSSGLTVKVEALIDNGAIIAKTIKVLSRFVSISLEGTVESFDGSTLELNLGDGVVLTVVVTTETEMRGEVTPGALVQLKGFINSDLVVEALRIRVRKLFELVPDELHLQFGESRDVLVVLAQELDFDLVLNLDAEDPTIAEVTSPAPPILTIPAGDTSGGFQVQAGDIEGKTVIRVTQEGAEANSRVLKVEVEEAKEGEEGDHELEVKWTPGVIHAAPNGSVEVRLMLKHGVAPADLEIPLQLLDWTEDPSAISFPGSVVIPEGSREVRFRIEFLTDSGSGRIRATLPEIAGGDSDDLEIGLVPSDPEAKERIKLQWSPSELKLAPGDNTSVQLVLHRPAPDPFDVTISVLEGNASTASLSSMTVSFPAGVTVASILVTAGAEEGRVVFQALAPQELGGAQARLKVKVEAEKSKKDDEEDDLEDDEEEDDEEEDDESGDDGGKKNGKGN